MSKARSPLSEEEEAAWARIREQSRFRQLTQGEGEPQYQRGFGLILRNLFVRAALRKAGGAQRILTATPPQMSLGGGQG